MEFCKRNLVFLGAVIYCQQKFSNFLFWNISRKRGENENAVCCVDAASVFSGYVAFGCGYDSSDCDYGSSDCNCRDNDYDSNGWNNDYDSSDCDYGSSDCNCRDNDYDSKE
jgi:hypothetical protein